MKIEGNLDISEFEHFAYLIACDKIKRQMNKNAEIVVSADNMEIYKKPVIALTPGEMTSITMSKNGIKSDIKVFVRERL